MTPAATHRRKGARLRVLTALGCALFCWAGFWLPAPGWAQETTVPGARTTPLDPNLPWHIEADRIRYDQARDGYVAEGDVVKYPILYLLHGAGDCDEAWTSVGRAGFILDNLIAARRVKPMIVVMPAGHTNTTPAGSRGATPATGAAAAPTPSPLDDFARDFLTDVMPYAEGNYRVTASRANRAIAGLSMGGSQTLNIAFLRLEQFAYIGSSAPAHRWAADELPRLRPAPERRRQGRPHGKPPTWRTSAIPR